uniref:Uncharacterized protein n=1 Tax=Oryza punctata TaxID=4537 RepID=A0A0E0LCK5_ORYPU
MKLMLVLDSIDVAVLVSALVVVMMK